MDSISFTETIQTTKIETKEAESIANGGSTKEILCDGYFYDVTNFISRHPGGSIIKYYTQTGEDATHAIQQFHQRSAKRVSMMMRSLKRRPASDSERNKLQLYCEQFHNFSFTKFSVGLSQAVLKKNRALTEDFTNLYLEFEREGLFEPSYTHIALRMVELIVMASVGYALIQRQSILANIIGSVLIGLVQGRSGWMQHESGHMSLSGSPKWDRIFHALFFG